nr:uncharacterized protein LOC118076276 isoform X1 [Zootoca vivipara]
MERCLRELLHNPPSRPGSPTDSSSVSSSPERVHPWTMEEVEALRSAQEDTESEIDWTLWQKGMEFRPRSELLAAGERALPSAREPELVTMGSRASSTSPLPILERFMAKIAMSQPLPSNIPPGDAKSPGEVAPRGSRQVMDGSHLTKRAAEKKPVKGVLKRLKELIDRHPPHIFRRNYNSSRQAALQQKTRKGTCGSPSGQAWSQVTSPLHSLPSCVKDIPDPRPQAFRASTGKRGGGGQEQIIGGKRERFEPCSYAATTEKQGSSP